MVGEKTRDSGELQPIIIGAGIGGLAFANALNAVGIPPRIYEKKLDPASVGSGILLSINAVKYLAALGFKNELQDRGYAIKAGEIRTSQGKLLRGIDYQPYYEKYGVHNIAIRRTDLHKILMTPVEKELKLGKQFTNYEIITSPDSVIANFQDGSRERGNILIGADGLHSMVSEQLHGSLTERPHRYTSFRGLSNIVAKKDEPIACEYWGRSHCFGFIRVNAQQIYWFIAYRLSEQTIPEDKNSIKTFLQKEFAEWTEPVPHLIDMTEPNEFIHTKIFDRAPNKKWYHGPVVLLGDAIHPTTPNMGQGAGMAIESAFVLAQCLKKYPFSEAFQRYFQARYQRTAWITNMSKRIGDITTFNSAVMCYLRDELFHLSPKFIQNGFAEKLFSYSVGLENQNK